MRAASPRLSGTGFLVAKEMVPLAAAGFHVIAPDQRGYGRTTGCDTAYDCDLRSFGLLNIVRDTLGLVSALGFRSVAAVVGHDFGSPVAAWCALVRPDVFHSVILMSAPFPGPPTLPFDTAAGKPVGNAKAASSGASLHEKLAQLDPPRKHYQWYYSTRQANPDMHDCPQGVHAFLRAYYHYKSADWTRNNPVPLKSFTASELAKMPTYYIMELHKGMAATVAPEMPSPAEIASCKWLTEQELSVYSAEYLRTGFQGGLNWYRCRTQKSTAPSSNYSPAQIKKKKKKERRQRRARTILRPADRSAFALHRRKEGLGNLSGTRQHRAHAEQRVHADAAARPGGRRRALGAAGAAREGVRAVARVSAAARSLTERSFSARRPIWDRRPPESGQKPLTGMPGYARATHSARFS